MITIPKVPQLSSGVHGRSRTVVAKIGVFGGLFVLVAKQAFRRFVRQLVDEMERRRRRSVTSENKFFAIAGLLDKSFNISPPQLINIFLCTDKHVGVDLEAGGFCGG